MTTEFEQNKRKAWDEFLKNPSLFYDFDMYAQDLTQWEWLSCLIPGASLTSAGGVVPFQASGLLHGLPFYYRERHGTASLSVAEAEESASGQQVLYRASEDVEEFRTGPEWIETLLNLVDRLEKAEFLWQFVGRRVSFKTPKDLESMYTSDEQEVYAAWGHDPAAARVELMKESAVLARYGWSSETQARYRELCQIGLVPVNKDDRVYPSPEPVFEVRVPDAWRTAEGRICVPEGFFRVSE